MSVHYSDLETKMSGPSIYNTVEFNLIQFSTVQVLGQKCPLFEFFISVRYSSLLSFFSSFSTVCLNHFSYAFTLEPIFELVLDHGHE